MDYDTSSTRAISCVAGQYYPAHYTAIVTFSLELERVLAVRMQFSFLVAIISHVVNNGINVYADPLELSKAFHRVDHNKYCFPVCVKRALLQI